MVFDIVLFNFRYSKQPILTEQAKPQDLPDKTSSYENFTQSKLNRFIHHDAKNRIQAPCKVSSFTDVDQWVLPLFKAWGASTFLESNF